MFWREYKTFAMSHYYSLVYDYFGNLLAFENMHLDSI